MPTALPDWRCPDENVRTGAQVEIPPTLLQKALASPGNIPLSDYRYSKRNDFQKYLIVQFVS
ncbi:MAG: hypothetical protein PHQ97_00675 [Desulfobacterales bacterium]|nr:hypothetical protein [Desulfobacterales bacterium]